MSLNSSSGSAAHPLVHRAKQQSMNAQRRNKNALKNNSKLNEVDELIEILPHFDYINNQTHFEIIDILEKKVNLEKNNTFIKKITSNLDENIIQRVKKGTYFEIGGALYQVTDMLYLDGGVVKAKEMFPENPENIPTRYTFTTKEVLDNIIPENKVGRKLIQYIVSMEPRGGNDNLIISPEIINHLDDRSKYLVYLFVDKDGNSHATMADVQLANDEIHKRRYPEIKNNLIINVYKDKNGNSHPTMDGVRRADAEIFNIMYPQKISTVDLITQVLEATRFISKK